MEYTPEEVANLLANKTNQPHYIAAMIQKCIDHAVENHFNPDNLDERMKAHGMMPVSEMLERNPLGRFSAHTGVRDLESFEQWVQQRRAGFIRQQATLTLDKQEDDEMYEWVIAHSAVLGEVMANFRQATEGTSE